MKSWCYCQAGQLTLDKIHLALNLCELNCVAKFSALSSKVHWHLSLKNETNQGLLSRTGVKEGQPDKYNWRIIHFLLWELPILLTGTRLHCLVLIVMIIPPWNKRKPKLLCAFPCLGCHHRPHAEPNHLHSLCTFDIQNWAFLVLDICQLKK